MGRTFENGREDGEREESGFVIMGKLGSSASRIILLALVGTLCVAFLGVLGWRAIPVEYGKEVITLFGGVITTIVGYYIGKHAQPSNGGDPLGGN